MVKLTKFFKLYKKSFGAFSSAYLIAIAFVFIWSYWTDSWFIDTSFTPNDFYENLLSGNIRLIITKVTNFPLDTRQHYSSDGINNCTSYLLWDLLNIIVLLPGLSQFEKIYGTIHTFCFLGLASPIIGVTYFVIGLIFCPDKPIYGIYLWNCVIWGYFIAQESKHGATLNLFINRKWRIPITWIPLFICLISSLLFNDISVVPAVISLMMGYLLLLIKTPILDLLLPPSFILRFIEDKIFGNDISGTSILFYHHIKYYPEASVKKGKKYKSLFSEHPGLPKSKSKLKLKLKSKNGKKGKLKSSKK